MARIFLFDKHKKMLYNIMHKLWKRKCKGKMMTAVDFIFMILGSLMILGLIVILILYWFAKVKESREEQYQQVFETGACSYLFRGKIIAEYSDDKSSDNWKLLTLYKGSLDGQIVCVSSHTNNSKKEDYSGRIYVVNVLVSNKKGIHSYVRVNKCRHHRDIWESLKDIRPTAETSKRTRPYPPLVSEDEARKLTRIARENGGFNLKSLMLLHLLSLWIGLMFVVGCLYFICGGSIL